MDEPTVPKVRYTCPDRGVDPDASGPRRAAGEVVDLAEWLNDALDRRFVERQADATNWALKALLCTLVDKGVLSVTEVIGIADPYPRVVDAALPAEDADAPV